MPNLRLTLIEKAKLLIRQPAVLQQVFIRPAKDTYILLFSVLLSWINFLQPLSGVPRTGSWPGNGVTPILPLSIDSFLISQSALALKLFTAFVFHLFVLLDT